MVGPLPPTGHTRSAVPGSWLRLAPDLIVAAI